MRPHKLSLEFKVTLSNLSASEETDTVGQLNRELRLQEIAAHYAQRSQDNSSSTGRNSSTCTQVVWIFFW